MSVYRIEPQEPAQSCIIWLHGLGADAADMMGVVQQFPVTINGGLRHVFINAPRRPITLNGGMVMPAWYDIIGFDLAAREDKEGIEQSESIIRQEIETQVKEGIGLERIILAGFSQGGAMALHTGLHTEGRLGGVIALCAYLPLAQMANPTLEKTTPIFMGAGQFDQVILPIWTEFSRTWLVNKGYEHISYHQYPMEHSICLQEINDIVEWIGKQLQGASL